MAALFTVATCVAAATDAPDTCIVGDGAIGCTSERSVIELTMKRKDANATREIVQQKLSSGECRRFEFGERVSLVSTKGSERSAVRRHGDRAIYWMPASWAKPAAECEPNASASTLRHKLGLPEPASQRQDDAADERTLADRVAAGADPARGDAEDRYDEDRAHRYDDRAYRNGERTDRERRYARDDDYEDDRSAHGYGDRPRWNDEDRQPRRADVYAERAWRSRYERWRDGERDEYRDQASATRPNLPLPSSRYAHVCDYRPVMSDADLAACRALRR